MNWQPDLKLRSYGRVSRNEDGYAEVDAEFYQTFWQWLTKKPATKKVWYFADGEWFDKNTDELASDEDVELICNIRYELDRIELL